MNVLYTDTMELTPLQLKRLLMTGRKIHFAERIGFDMRPTLMHLIEPESGVKHIVKPVTTDFLEVTYGHASETFKIPGLMDLMDAYMKTDTNNRRFVNTVLNGIEKRSIYSDVFKTTVESGNNSCSLEDWVIANKDQIAATDLGSIDRFAPGSVKSNLEYATFEGGVFALKLLLKELSMGVTFLLVTAANEQRVPLSSNPVINELIALRLSDPTYTGEPKPVKKLPMCIMESVLSDDALRQIPYDDILSFREKAKDYYEAWSVETAKIESQLLTNGFHYKEAEIERYVREEVNPGVQKLKREIEKIKVDMFQDIVLSAKAFAFAAITSGTISAYNIPTAIGAFILTNIKTGKLVDGVIKNLFKTSSLKKDNGLTYLLEATKLTGAR